MLPPNKLLEIGVRSSKPGLEGAPACLPNQSAQRFDLASARAGDEGHVGLGSPVNVLR